MRTKLRLAHVVLVDTDVLEADEVLSLRNVLWDGESHAVLLPGAPRGVDVGRAVLRAAFPDLEPVTVTHVVGDGARGLGHVDHAGAGVLDELIVPELGADAVTGLRLVGACRGGKGALVATKVLAVEELEPRRLVVVGVLADVLVVATDGLVVDNELRENVVTLDHGGCQQRRGESVHRLDEHGRS